MNLMMAESFSEWWINLSCFDVTLSFASNLLAALCAFLLGLFFRGIPTSWRELRFRRFFGTAVVQGRFVICHGSVQVNPTSRSPFIKIFRDGTAFSLSGPSENVMGDSEMRSASHLVQELSRYRKDGGSMTVEADNRAFSRLDRTLIALGSGSSNEVTRLILAEPSNVFLEFVQENGEVFIRDKRTDRRYEGFKGPIRKDYGIILRLANTRFPGTLLFVCAGLGDWGTSGASWFLASRWSELHSMFKGNFGVVVEVDIGSDQSARRIRDGDGDGLVQVGEAAGYVPPRSVD